MDIDQRRASTFVALGAVAIILTEALHPKPQGDTVSEAKLAMLQTDGWVAGHLPQVVGMVLLAIGFGALRRHLGGRASQFAAVAAAGAVVGTVEVFPHMFAAWQVDQIVATGSSPMLVAHGLLQALATPLVGLGIAGVAATAGLAGRFGARPVAFLGIIGGIGWGIAGPAVLLTESMTLAKAFMAGAPMSLWLVIAGVQGVRGAVEVPEPAAAAAA